MTLTNMINLNGTVCTIIQRNSSMLVLERNGHRARYYPATKMLVYRQAKTGRFIARQMV